ncbi:MAG: hypothetical protein ISS77_05175 [Phycisphaerae bacterium]|nr:hypothetical protein [Phycisphaerae bacterium]
MNGTQKGAWFQLIVITLAAIASVVNSFLYMHKYGYSFSKAWWFGTGWPVIICVFLIVFATTFSKTFSKFYRKKGAVLFDERDLLIQRQASRFGYAAAFVFFVASFIITSKVVGMDTLMPVYWLGRFFLGGFFTASIVHAITTLILYGRGGKDGE